MDSLADFINTLKRGPNLRGPAKKVYAAYTEWCQTTAGERPLTLRGFRAKMRERGYVLIKSNGVDYWEGLDVPVELANRPDYAIPLAAPAPEPRSVPTPPGQGSGAELGSAAWLRKLVGPAGSDVEMAA